MRKIGQNPKFGQIWRPVAPQPYVVQKSRPDPRNSLALGLQRGVMATLHYSNRLQTWLQTRFSTRFAARFSTSSCGFATCFRHAFDTISTFFVKNLVANLLHQSRFVEIDAAGSLVRARARQMECRKKNPFKPANEPVKAGFSLRILLLVLIMT